MGQVKAKRPNPTPERSAGAVGGGGGGRTPSTMHGAAGCTPHPGDSGGEGSGDGGRGRRNDKQNKKPGAKEKSDVEKYGEATEDEIQFSRALGKAIGETTKRPAQHLSKLAHAKHQDIRFWLTTSKDIFDRNTYQ